MRYFRIHQAALNEGEKAYEWYAERSLDVADRFWDQMQAAIASATTSPLRYPSYLHRTRRVLIKKFPYSVVFLDRGDCTLVLAIAHAKRNPGYWQDRVDSVL